MRPEKWDDQPFRAEMVQSWESAAGNPGLIQERFNIAQKAIRSLKRRGAVALNKFYRGEISLGAYNEQRLAAQAEWREMVFA